MTSTTKPDVVVIGGGIFGLSCAYACLRAGASVLLVEADEIGSGASGGVVGALAPHTPDNWNEKKQFQFESLQGLPEYWARVDALSGRTSGYVKSGRIAAIDDARSLQHATDRIGGAVTFWHATESWFVKPVEDFPGWAPRTKTGMMSHDTLSALISPAQACYSLAAAILALGGTITCGQTISIEDALAMGGAVIQCTGYEGLIEASVAAGEIVGKGVKGQAALFECDARGRPQIFAENLHVIPHNDGTVAAGSTSEIEWSIPNETDHQLNDLIIKAIGVCPMLKDAPVLKRWAGVRPRARSRSPLLGPHPVHPRAFVANGGFKIGFGIAPLVGHVMADLVLNDRNAIPRSFLPTARH